MVLFIIQSLGIDETGTLAEYPLAGSTSSRAEGSENIGVQSMQMDAPPIDSFTQLEATAISCVLEECLEKLVRFSFTIPADVDPCWDNTFKTIDEMYGVPDEPRIIFREDMGLLSLVPTASEKLQRDRCICRNTIFAICKYSTPIEKNS